ncbi:MAG: hypothetical protein KDK70_25395 [Myxococcales bacterium]|nr:hypothetical protein [Myxococcales bacterium]
MSAAAAAPTHAISPDAPWARAIDDALSKPLVEQWYGREVAEAWNDIEPHWSGTQLLTRESFDEQLMAQLGVSPVPAMGYEPSPGVVYVAMDGVTLSPDCPNGDTANSALDCSPLVQSEVSFPAFSGGQAAAEYEQLRQYYSDFDLVMTSARPPSYLPYTMTVIGGSANLAGLGGGVCGVANVACDGLKRNHVSLNFPQSCGGMAETAAQETSHNWGLEHTDNPTDLLYPFNNGGFKTFVDECMPISDATGDGVTQCGYIHEVYCEAGAGEEQNSFAEMMGVFGPRTEDTTAPEITSVLPADGSVFSTNDSITITAQITEDSRMVGVQWTWLEGLPPGTDSYTRCTNNTCTQDYNPGPSFVAEEINWDFVVLDQPPAGHYVFQIEVIDAYGNYDTETIAIDVTADGEPPPDDTGSVDDTGTDGNVTGDGPGDTGADTSAGEGTGDGGQDGGGDGGSGGGCRMDGPRWSWLGLWGLALVAVRRRRR